MTTPIYDFVRKYANSGYVRAHMPGHKGVPQLGCEPLDLTEIAGADELFAPDGIIAESEANAGSIFGCRTLYSTEGSSLCIRAMLYLAMKYAKQRGKQPVIAAARNVHKTFLTAAALLGFETVWLQQNPDQSYLSGGFALPDSFEQQPAALYLTSPDYLGGIADIRAAADFCHAHDMLLLVDNAHGAYLKFLQKPLHPTETGADLCCDSAHKTLPVLTGGAYLHIADSAPEICHSSAKQAMSLFASTSPSYLILESLDLCNAYLSDHFTGDLYDAVASVKQLRDTLSTQGWRLTGDEPLKLTLCPKPYGYTGTALADLLRKERICVEFADPDYLIMMLSPQNSAADFAYIADVLAHVPRRAEITERPPQITQPDCIMHPREAVFSETELLPVMQCIGRICAEFAVSCPPAVPVVMCGERITAVAAACMQYYGIERCMVVK